MTQPTPIFQNDPFFCKWDEEALPTSLENGGNTEHITAQVSRLRKGGLIRLKYGCRRKK